MSPTNLRRPVEETQAVLRAARLLLATRQQWTKRAFARDRHSHEAPFDSPRAVRFCAVGALLRADVDLAGPSSQPDGDDALLSPAGVRAVFLVATALSHELSLHSWHEYRTALEAAVACEGEDRDARVSDAATRILYYLGAINDLPRTQHGHVLRAFDQAIDSTVKTLRRMQPRRRRRTSGAGESTGGNKRGER